MQLDFTSSLYLGLWHEYQSLKPWSQMTKGQPAYLDESQNAESVEHQLAVLQGCEQSVLGRSSLHLFWDLFGILAKEWISIFLDAGSYPIARWGVERAMARGIPVHSFPHKDADALFRLLKYGTTGRKPVIVSDGVCTSCNCAMPLAKYKEMVLNAGGLLILDDTQALGILGANPRSGFPYGFGGGGSLQYQNIFDLKVLIVASLAKGFGVPIAVLSGSGEMIEKFKWESETRVHCSPPSAVDIHATEHALAINRMAGDALRMELAQRVQHFRHRLASLRISSDGGLFPVQTLRLPPHLDPENVHRQLLRLGVRTILRSGCDSHKPSLTLIITVRHSLIDIENAVQALARVVNAGTYIALEGG